jgi:hypothetical protein
VEGCSKAFQTETEFETHVKSKHTDLAAPEIFSALRKTSTRGSSMSEMVPCRLCGKCMTLRAMQKHMGHHHEQLALFALPPNLDGTEEDHEEDELNSLSNNDDAGSDKEWLENEESDMSDASDPDEIADERQRFVEAVESLEGPISPDTFRKIFTGLGSTEDEADDITYGVGARSESRPPFGQPA